MDSKSFKNYFQTFFSFNLQGFCWKAKHWWHRIVLYFFYRVSFSIRYIFERNCLNFISRVHYWRTLGKIALECLKNPMYMFNTTYSWSHGLHKQVITIWRSENFISILIYFIKFLEDRPIILRSLCNVGTKSWTIKENTLLSDL